MKRQTTSVTITKLNPRWVKQTLREFRGFLQETHFPDPVRNGTRGSYFNYPEWLIMFIAVLAVKTKVESYVGIHRLVVEYWSLLRPDPNLKPISESQLRERLKKIGHTPGAPAGFIFQLFSPADLA
jgi:hypothetical protein